LQVAAGVLPQDEFRAFFRGFPVVGEGVEDDRAHVRALNGHHRTIEGEGNAAVFATVAPQLGAVVAVAVDGGRDMAVGAGGFVGGKAV